MFVLAAMLAMLLVAFVLALKPAAYALLLAVVVALILHWRGRRKAKPPKSLALAGGVLLVALATVLINMYVMISAELAPTQEIMSKTKILEEALGQTQQDHRFAEAKTIVDSGTTDAVRRRLGETVLDVFRGADYRQEDISTADLRTIELLLSEFYPTSAGFRSCSVYYSHLYARQTGPEQVHQVLSQYPTAIADCGGRVEYLMLVRRRCARSAISRAQCAERLPRDQLVALRNEPASDPGTRHALDELFVEAYGTSN